MNILVVDDEKNIAEPDIEANIEVENPTRK